MPMATTQIQESPTLNRLRTIITAVASIEPTDISATQSVWEDLQISAEITLPKIIKLVNEQFGTALTKADILDQVETVAEFVELIDNEVELG